MSDKTRETIEIIYNCTESFEIKLKPNQCYCNIFLLQGKLKSLEVKIGIHLFLLPPPPHFHLNTIMLNVRINR